MLYLSMNYKNSIYKKSLYKIKNNYFKGISED